MTAISDIASLREISKPVDDPIYISSDEEDVCNISSDDDDDVQIVNDSQSPLSRKACNKNVRNYPVKTEKIADFTQPFIESVATGLELESVCLSDDSDLPDIYDISCDTRGSLNQSIILSTNASKSTTSDTRGLLNLAIIHGSCASESTAGSKRSAILRSDSPPACKISKKEDDNSKIKWREEFIHSIQKNMCSSFLRGCVHGTMKLGQQHQLQMKVAQIDFMSMNHFKTMMDNNELHSFAIRSLCKAVTCAHFLGPDLMHQLVLHLMGSEEKMEAPPLEDFHLGISTLHKQLIFYESWHPLLKKHYLQLCRHFWPELLEKLRSLLKKETPVLKNKQLHEDVIATDDTDYFDFSSCVRKKREERQNRFLNLTQKEKMHRIYMLLKYFIEVFATNTQYWFQHKWHEKCPAFRTDIKPILYEMSWKNRSEFGNVNLCVKQMFDLYCNSIEERCVHHLLGRVVSLQAAVIHRSERSVYPEMDTMTVQYAFELYRRIKLQTSEQILAIVTDLQPDWLKFHVVSFFLSVDQPSNFFKLKERIVQVLCQHDRGLNNEYLFNVEKMCVLGFQAMMGMLELRSSTCEACEFPHQLMEGNMEETWFKRSLQKDKVENGLKIIKSLLNTPCVSSRKTYKFDGFEDDVRKI